MIYLTKQVDLTNVVLAWGYVGTRFVHSYIHTTNNVRHRMIPFLLGGIVLIVIWVRLFIQIIISLP